jgi:hypothetical protein
MTNTTSKNIVPPRRLDRAFMPFTTELTLLVSYFVSTGIANTDCSDCIDKTRTEEAGVA